MPYKILHTRQGYFVSDIITKERFSKNPFSTREKATKQMFAIAYSEIKKTGYSLEYYIA